MSQVETVTMLIRRMVLDGELEPGETLSEASIERKLNMSRTPVRLAFKTLESEGLIVRQSPRRYRVRSATEKDINNAIEVRGVLEGLAARTLAESGASKETLSSLRENLIVMDAALSEPELNEVVVTRFGEANCSFHQTIVRASNNTSIAQAIELNDHMPLASVSSIGFSAANPEQERLRFQYGNAQHHLIFRAIQAGNGARAEMLMREHAYSANIDVGLFGTTENQNLKVIHSLSGPTQDQS